MKNLRFGMLAIFSLGAFFLTRVGVLRADEAADFPPGMFTDGGRYSLESLKGKVVVLFFFEEACPRCRGLIPERNKLMQSLKDKPVKFIAVDPGHNLNDSNAYVQETKFRFPVFSDPLRLMEKRYKENISLNNIYQWKVIDANGNIVAFTDTEVAKVVDKVEWKYKGKYDPALNDAVEAFEWNQDAAGIQRLKPLLKDKHKPIAEDAAKLLAEIKPKYEQMKEDADKSVEEKPIEAYDLYAKIADVFYGDPLAKSVAEPMKKLAKKKAVKDELAARQMFVKLYPAMSRATPDRKRDVANFCLSISTDYPETPTGKRAAALATELGAPTPAALGIGAGEKVAIGR